MTETGTRTGTRTMWDNRYLPINVLVLNISFSYFRCNGGCNKRSQRSVSCAPSGQSKGPTAVTWHIRRGSYPVTVGWTGAGCRICRWTLKKKNKMKDSILLTRIANTLTIDSKLCSFTPHLVSYGSFTYTETDRGTDPYLEGFALDWSVATVVL